jgi:hypothetical protein
MWKYLVPTLICFYCGIHYRSSIPTMLSDMMLLGGCIWGFFALVVSKFEEERKLNARVEKIIGKECIRDKNTWDKILREAKIKSSK